MRFGALVWMFFLALPWWIGAMPGPVDQLGAWMAAGLCLAALLFVGRLRAWPQSLMLAALVSLGLGLLQFAGLAPSVWPWGPDSAAGEMVAQLRQRNQFATLMAIGMLALLWALQTNTGLFHSKNSQTGRAKHGALRMPALVAAAALLGFASALSGSRTGLLQWLALLGLAWVWRGSSQGVWREASKWMLGAAALAYALGVLLAPWLAQMAGHGNAGLLGRASDENAFSRLALWSNTLELIAQEPLLGQGWRSLAYVHYATDFSAERFMEMPDNAHNLPLHLAVELGLPVALAFCGLVGWLIWKSKPWNETRPDRQLAWGVLMVMGIHSLLEYPLWYGPFFMTAVICIGILCADIWRKWLIAGTDNAQDAIILGVRCLGLALLAFTAFAAFDYHRVSQIYLSPEERSPWYAADPLAAAKKSVLFPSHAKFAELQITPLSKESAPRLFELSQELVKWSPEPRIIEKLIESSVMLGRDEVAAFHLKRYRVAYPKAHALWSQRVR